VRVVETKEMETDKIQFVTASQMAAQIETTGKVALYGILFDFDKDVIKPESKPTLDEIAFLLSARPELRLNIVGHTDNQGSADYNLDLSQRRAASVAAALTAQYGVAPDRLAAGGAGMTQPVDTNDTEEGRAKNRRVELQAQTAAAVAPAMPIGSAPALPVGSAPAPAPASPAVPAPVGGAGG
jgi:OOP family OmpA-OmpF porin